jgi:hypothetical protein
MRSALLLPLVLVGACHVHRDLNAPGVIDPATPPTQLGRHGLEYPGDPGERMLVVSGGVLGGGGGGQQQGGGFGDFAAEATVSWGESPTSHNDAESRLFLPRGVLLPLRSWGLTLGWSALRLVPDASDQTAARVGPIYVEAQRSWLFAGAGAGWAYDPRTRATGPQVQGFYTFYFSRVRYLFGGGWEFTGGVQLKFPATWVWRR